MTKASEKALSDVNRMLGLDLKQAEPWALVAICVAEIERRDNRISELSIALNEGIEVAQSVFNAYPRSDISHEDYRVQVAHWAEDFIDEYGELLEGGKS
jgi:hypothetical protein